MIFNCPACKKPIGELSGAGEADLTCGHCRFKYRVVTGKLMSHAAKTGKVPSKLQLRYQGHLEIELHEMQLELADGSRRVVPFETTSDYWAIALAVGDLISAVYTLRDRTVDEMLAVIDHTSGVTYTLRRAGQRERSWAFWLGTSVGAITLTILAGTPLDPAAILGLTAAAGGASYFGFREIFSTKTRLAPAQQRLLTQVQSLLERKRDMEEQLQRITRQRTEKTALKDRLDQLRAKMEQVDPRLYQLRIEQLAAARATLDAQIALDDQLIDGYQRSVAILEIEIESNSDMETLPADIAEVLRAREDELAAIQAQNQELELQLSANQEVERLLRS